MEKWHAAKPKSIVNGGPAPAAVKPAAAAKPAAAPVHDGLRRGARARVRARRARGRHHRRDELRHRPEHPPEGACPSATSTSASPSSTRSCSRAGLALQGAKPVAAIYSTFLQRAFDQIVHDVCLQRLNVVFAMDRAGLVGDDGPTHHGAFDIAYLRCLPNIVADGAARRGDARRTCCTPRCSTTTARSRCATRAARPRASRCPSKPRAIEIGTGEILREGERSRCSATAPACSKALEAADLLAEPRPRGHRRRRALRQAARRRAGAPSSPPSTTCSSRSRRACWRAASAPPCGRRLSDGGPDPAHPARRPARPLRDPRQAPALLHEEVGLHRRAHRRADRGGGARAARQLRRRLNFRRPMRAKASGRRRAGRPLCAAAYCVSYEGTAHRHRRAVLEGRRDGLLCGVADL